MSNPGPLDGIGDIEPTLDLESEIAAATVAPAEDPMKTALRAVREDADLEGTDDDVPLEEDAEAKGDETPADDKPVEGDEELEEDAELDAEEDAEAQAESELTEEDKEDKVPTFEYEIPGFRDSRGERTDYVLEGLPQEVRDTLRGHVTRSQQADGLEIQLEGALGYEVAATFVDEHPKETIEYLVENNAELEREMLRDLIVTNPKEVRTILEELDFENAEEKSLNSEARAVRAERKGRLREAQAAQSVRSTNSRFSRQAGATIRSMMDSLNIDPTDRDEFAEMAARRVARTVQSRSRKGSGDPFLSAKEIQHTAKEVAKRFNGGKPSTPEETQESLKRRAKVAKKTRVIGGRGTGGGRPGGQSTTQADELKGKSMKELAAGIRSGKIRVPVPKRRR